jgi:hypothetical protein
MEWNTTDFDKLVKEYESKVGRLEDEGIKSDLARHELYNKRNSGIVLTAEEDRFIENACEFEAGINEQIKGIVTSKTEVFEALDNLKEKLDEI